MPPDTLRRWALDDVDGLFADVETAHVVVEPEQAGPGSWAGAPSAVAADGAVFLAYRLRRPVGQGRGYANVVARSSDGIAFTVVAEIGKDRFGAESLERPALVRTPEGRWRLYVSAATPGTKHWRVDLPRPRTVPGRCGSRLRSCEFTQSLDDPLPAIGGRRPKSPKASRGRRSLRGSGG